MFDSTRDCHMCVFTSQNGARTILIKPMMKSQLQIQSTRPHTNQTSSQSMNSPWLKGLASTQPEPDLWVVCVHPPRQLQGLMEGDAVVKLWWSSCHRTTSSLQTKKQVTTQNLLSSHSPFLTSRHNYDTMQTSWIGRRTKTNRNVWPNSVLGGGWSAFDTRFEISLYRCIGNSI